MAHQTSDTSTPATTAAGAPRWWVLGGSGMTGTSLIKLLGNNPQLAAHTTAWVRRAGTLTRHPNLSEVVVDLADTSSWPAIAADIAVSCLGTTIKTAGSQAAFKAVDYDLVVAMAHHAKRCGVKQFFVISALGANAQSPVFYNRVKGQMQQALEAIGFESLVILQPSLLDGHRKEFRLGEQVGLVVMRLFKPVIPLQYRAIEADTIARAIASLSKKPEPGVRIVGSGQLQTLGGQSCGCSEPVHQA